MYKLNKQSTTVKFYEWLWQTDVTKFKTMCPFFWKYLFSMIFIVPILIAKLIVYLIPAKKQIESGWNYVSETKVGKVTENVTNTIINQPKLWYYTGKTIKWIFLSIYFTVIALSFGFMLYNWYLHPIEGFALLGAGLLILSVIFIIIHFFVKKNVITYIKQPFIFLGNMISDLYRNICPLLIWVDKKEDK
jgi:hypothetical protein